MLMAVRIYGSEANAHEAVRRLVEAGVRQELIHVLTPKSGVAEQAVQAAVLAKKLPARYAKAAVAAMGNGRSIVSLPLPYDGQEALNILDSCDPVDTESLPAPQLPNDPAPFSDMLGIPTLTKGGGSSARLLTGPIFKSFLGLPLLSKPKSKTTSFGLPLLSKPKSKTTSFGLPLLSKPKSKTTSFGLPLLTKSKK
jgi:hypothetical protein